MTKSVYEFWLSQGKDKLRLPVLPEAIDIANSVQNDSVKVTGLGEVTFIEEPGAKEISFSSFPKRYSPIVEYQSIPSPEKAISAIEAWMKAKNPFSF